MKLRLLSITLFIFCLCISNANAQSGEHSLQVDDGMGHYSTIKASPTTATYTLPAGGGTLVTSTSTLPFADFFALMPPDNAATVAANNAVSFPQDGSNSGVISRTGPSTFNLPNIGTYEVSFQVSVNEPGQLMLRVNGISIANSVVGRATGTSQLTGTSLITTSVINSIVEVINPAGNPTALTITPLAGGTHPVSAHLVIKQLQ